MPLALNLFFEVQDFDTDRLSLRLAVELTLCYTTAGVLFHTRPDAQDGAFLKVSCEDEGAEA
ncbi:hypothetical protein SAMN00808754_1252 [Thermanaeromonas toyohensis ToBE]|uniref:Uncharacterized protein n=1 Tax=Thermanaeromonas toyohensis ToBE TaxID=698762 RepID=A0A1W1VQ30_9FIRM|nr:hypothetical protein SAMN00808754_1252 [Thermanaeromonas toyohensis ToBE]